MIVQLMGDNPAEDTYPSYGIAVAGPTITVTVAGVDVVASDLVRDAIVHAEVRRLDDGSFALSEVGDYVGTVIIPALSYIENDAISDGADGVMTVDPTPEALDANSIVLQLWPIESPLVPDLDAAEEEN